MRIISRDLEIDTAKTAYYTFIDSYLRYGISFWGMCNSSLLNGVLILHKRAVRSLCNLGPREYYRDAFSNNKMRIVISPFI